MILYESNDYHLQLGFGEKKAIQYNREQLKSLMEDCVQDHCRLGERLFDRCYEIETSIEEIAQDMKIQNVKGLDHDWREYSKCRKSIS